jgi:histidine triad (HIT) family protein
MLTEEQLQNVKLHLLKQLENFPEDQRKIVKHKIISMNREEMEKFLEENKLDYDKVDEKPEKQQCIFCALSSGKITSYKIDEDEEYMAILELNPLSRGHVLILPKKHVSLEGLSDSAIEFAKKVAGILFDKLNPKDIQFQKNEVLGHAALEVVPVYGEDKMEKKRASDEELQKLQKELVGESVEVPEKVVSEKKLELPKIEAAPEVQKPQAPVVEKKLELPKIKPRVGWI